MQLSRARWTIAGAVVGATAGAFLATRMTRAWPANRVADFGAPNEHPSLAVWAVAGAVVAGCAASTSLLASRRRRVGATLAVATVGAILGGIVARDWWWTSTTSMSTSDGGLWARETMHWRLPVLLGAAAGALVLAAVSAARWPALRRARRGVA